MPDEPLSANQVYALDAQRISTDLWEVERHVPEVAFYEIPDDTNTRVQLREICLVDYDGERMWALATVWLDERPVMIVQQAGRGGTDHRERYVTDRSAYFDMVAYLHGLQQPDPEEGLVIDPDEPLAELTCFYGETLASARQTEAKLAAGRARRAQQAG